MNTISIANRKNLPEITNSEMQALVDNFHTDDGDFTEEFLENLWERYHLRDRSDMAGQILVGLRKLSNPIGVYDEDFLYNHLKRMNEGSLARLYLHYCV